MLGVLNKVLEAREYLVGNKISYAGMSFITWLEIVPWVSDQSVIYEKDYPNVHVWMERISLHRGVKRILDLNIKLPQK